MNNRLWWYLDCTPELWSTLMVVIVCILVAVFIAWCR